jgi:hypothetical protein
MPKETPEQREARIAARLAEKAEQRAVQIPAGRKKAEDLIAEHANANAAHAAWRAHVAASPPMGTDQHQYIISVLARLKELGYADPIIDNPIVYKNADDVYHEVHGLEPRKGSSLRPITDEERGIGKPIDPTM